MRVVICSPTSLSLSSMKCSSTPMRLFSVVSSYCYISAVDLQEKEVRNSGKTTEVLVAENYAITRVSPWSFESSCAYSLV